MEEYGPDPIEVCSGDYALCVGDRCTDNGDGTASCVCQRHQGHSQYFPLKNYYAFPGEVLPSYFSYANDNDEEPILQCTGDGNKKYASCGGALCKPDPDKDGLLCTCIIVQPPEGEPYCSTACSSEVIWNGSSPQVDGKTLPCRKTNPPPSTKKGRCNLQRPPDGQRPRETQPKQ